MYISTYYLDLQIETWSSSVYEHFKKPTVEMHSGGIIKYIFVCKRDP